MQPTKEQIEQWHNDPKNWKWGSIYYNPEDPRSWVDKRIKWMGWTVNFGNKKGVFSFIVLIIVLSIWIWFLTNYIK